MKYFIAIIAALAAVLNTGAQTIIPLASDTAAMLGYTHKVVITAADVKAAAAASGASVTNVTLRLFPENTSSGIASNSIISGLAVVLDQTFTNLSGAQQTALGFQLGDAGDVDRYIQLSVGPTNAATFAATNTFRFENSSTNYFVGGFFGTNANTSVPLTNLTSGRLNVFFNLVPLKGR
jgi:hypothetical protein